ncbi:MAG TPA: hypothetical protein VN679_03080 [Candidatus Acidoferrales bacterium]|nr:hypothetical protein [Candidatus Acidoferrales bacterium]
MHIIDSYVHNRRVGVLIELSAESDYATQTNEFKALVKDIAMHIAATSPLSVATLLEQPFIKDPACNVGQLLAKISSSLRERVSVVRFVRWDTEFVPTADPAPPKNPAVALRNQLRA